MINKIQLKVEAIAERSLTQRQDISITFRSTVELKSILRNGTTESCRLLMVEM